MLLGERARHADHLEAAVLEVVCLLRVKREDLEGEVLVGRDERGQGVGPGAERLARRAEVEKDRRAVLADVDVVGLDVAVDESLLVDALQPVEDRLEDGEQGLLAAQVRALANHASGGTSSEGSADTPPSAVVSKKAYSR